MINELETLITVAGWEERFIRGMEKLLADNRFKEIILLVAEEYEKILADRINEASQLSELHGVNLKIVKFKIHDNVYTWEKIELGLSHVGSSSVIFDISTAPREIIWFVLHFLRQNSCCIECVYSSPVKYGSWLSRDPGKPRLVFKHSGITRLDLPTALVIISGFDLERASQLVQYFEPKKAILAIQSGEQYENNELNTKKNIEKLSQLCDVEHITINSFSSDCSLNSLEGKLVLLKENYNIIATSLGPKPSAVALFDIQEKHPEIALCYVPSLSYNTIDYSSGFKGYSAIRLLDKCQ